MGVVRGLTYFEQQQIRTMPSGKQDTAVGAIAFATALDICEARSLGLGVLIPWHEGLSMDTWTGQQPLW
jgi:hypothetical protein